MGARCLPVERGEAWGLCWLLAAAIHCAATHLLLAAQLLLQLTEESLEGPKARRAPVVWLRYGSVMLYVQLLLLLQMLLAIQS